MAKKAEKIRDWYIAAYPEDELGLELNPNITFTGIFNFLRKPYKGVYVYDVLGVGDSLIRERVFARLAEIRKVDYDVIYDMWLAA